MTKLNPPKKNQPRPPTLHLDIHQAWQQNEDAVIIPIVYDFLDTARNAAKCDCLIIPTSPPISPPISLAASSPEEILSPMEEAIPGREFLKSESKTREFQPLSITQVGSVGMDSFFLVPSGSALLPAKHLSTAVPLLLLGGIALVLFAWMAFR
jgi:hypothetical protein